MSVSPSVIKKILLQMDLLTEKAHKKKLFASFHQYFPRKACHIIDRNTVCNSVGDYLKIFFKTIYLTELENN
jgi:hypothetical protein